MRDGLVVYAGDGELTGAAAYLAGLLTTWSIPFDHVASSCPLPDALVDQAPSLYVLSDYPAAHCSAAQQRRIAEQVDAGTGLLMIGGWSSFRGLRGRWHGSVIASKLPVEIEAEDDRVACDQVAIVRRGAPHVTTDGLSWEAPPCIGGFNRVRARPNSHVALWVERYATRIVDDQACFDAVDRHPLLVLGEAGLGRTAALTTDCAPHWVGGLIDWGPDRVAAQAKSARPIDVGSGYARLLENVVRWAMHR